MPCIFRFSKILSESYKNYPFAIPSHYTRHKHVLLMIVLSWLLAPVITCPMFSPHMTSENTWDIRTQAETCLPPTTSDDLPWILYVTILAFIIPFTALIVLQIMVLIKQQSSMDIILSRFEKKVRTSLAMLLLGFACQQKPKLYPF